jgi:ABC-type lipoprotein export system ATPase subunit
MTTSNLPSATLTAADLLQPGGGSADAVVLSNVSKRYGRRHGVPALNDVTARFPRGSFTAVMGLSGSGKSTLLQCAAGLDQPSSGSVHLGGVELTRLSRRKLTVTRRERAGFVFQSLNLVPTLSVAENIALPLRLGGRRVDQARIRRLAERVGLADQLRRLPDTLSGGQQQRVAIARALITEPEGGRLTTIAGYSPSYSPSGCMMTVLVRMALTPCRIFPQFRPPSWVTTISCRASRK